MTRHTMPVIVKPSKRPSIAAMAFAILRAEDRAPRRTPIPAKVKAKPGKRTPNKAERQWLEFVVRYGCVACRIDGHAPRPTVPHHLVEGGRRLGHLFTIGLCDPGHHQGGQALGLVSRHPNKATFEKRYGTERQLLASLRKARNRELAGGNGKGPKLAPQAPVATPTQRRAV